jgi:hypothetical protein
MTYTYGLLVHRLGLLKCQSAAGGHFRILRSFMFWQASHLQVLIPIRKLSQYIHITAAAAVCGTCISVHHNLKPLAPTARAELINLNAETS